MALSFNSVKTAYKIFHELEVEHIPSWPDDMALMNQAQRENPKLDTVYGWDKKSDDGWENLFFLRKNPTPEFVAKFSRLASAVPNSTFCEQYSYNSDLWIFGWF